MQAYDVGSKCLTQEEEIRVDAWERSIAQVATDEVDQTVHVKKRPRRDETTKVNPAITSSEQGGTTTGEVVGLEEPVASSSSSPRHNLDNSESVDNLASYSLGVDAGSGHYQDSETICNINSSALALGVRRSDNEMSSKGKPWSCKLSAVKAGKYSSVLCVVLDAQPLGMGQWGLQVGDHSCKFFPIICTHLAGQWAQEHALVGRTILLHDTFFRNKSGSIHGFQSERQHCFAVPHEEARIRTALQIWAGPLAAEAERLRHDLCKIFPNIARQRGILEKKPGSQITIVRHQRVEPLLQVLRMSRLNDEVAVSGRILSLSRHGKNPHRRMLLMTIQDESATGKVQLWGEKASDEHFDFLQAMQENNVCVTCTKCRVIYSYRREEYCLNERIGTEVLDSVKSSTSRASSTREPRRFSSIAALRATPGLQNCLIQVPGYLQGPIQGDFSMPIQGSISSSSNWQFSSVSLFAGDDRQRHHVPSSRLKVQIQHDRVREITCGLVASDLSHLSIVEALRDCIVADRNSPFLLTMLYTRHYDEHGFPLADGEDANLQALDFIPVFRR